jgi:hypothetical protein
MSMNKKIDMGNILFSLDHMNKKKTFTRYAHPFGRLPDPYCIR